MFWKSRRIEELEWKVKHLREDVQYLNKHYISKRELNIHIPVGNDVFSHTTNIHKAIKMLYSYLGLVYKHEQGYLELKKYSKKKSTSKKKKSK